MPILASGDDFVLCIYVCVWCKRLSMCWQSSKQMMRGQLCQRDASVLE